MNLSSVWNFEFKGLNISSFYHVSNFFVVMHQSFVSSASLGPGNSGAFNFLYNEPFQVNLIKPDGRIH